MKRKYIYIALLAALSISCTVEEIVDPKEEFTSDDVFYAYTEDHTDDASTKVYVDAENSHIIRWNKDDRITIFNRKTVGTQYAFQGDDGSSSGAFSKVKGENGTDQGVALPVTYAVYPYDGETAIQTDGTISFNLPATQKYLRDDSFGKDANLMVAKTEDTFLKFKNAVGYLTLRLYGNRNMSISSITLEGNKGEILAGPCEIKMSGDTPGLTMKGGDDAVTKIKLFCEEVVELSTNNNNCKEFWFVLPPMTFSGGFKVTIATSDGGVATKSTDNELTISRNQVSRMAPFQVTARADNNLKINSLTTICGKEEKKQNGQLVYENGQVVLIDKSYTSTPSNDGTITFTLPTFTDFPHFKLSSYNISQGAVLKANDQVIESNTPFDVSGSSVALTVCNGEKEKRYTLVVQNTGLPVVRITTDGFTQKDLESKKKYQDSNGNWIDEREWWPSETKPGSASFHIDKADGTVDLDHASMTIKGRGNATWKYNKRPFAIKLDEKSKVLDMKSHKRWILLANWKDRTLLRNDAAFWLSQKTELTLSKTDDNGNIIKEKVGLPYSVHGQFVELEFNGVHRGNYYLCEQIKIGGKRVNITDMTEDSEEDTPWFHPDARKTGGFLMEIDNNYDEDYKFLSGFYNGGLKYMFKEPEGPDPEKGITEAFFNEAKDYMTTYITNMETEIKGISTSAYQANYDDEDYGYRYYLDMDSAIWFMFVNELTGNGDFFNTDGEMNTTYYGPHSTYFYKDRDVMNVNGEITTHNKLHFGPVWDFDYLTFYDKNGTRSSRWVGVAESGYYYYYFTQDPKFRARTKELWRAYKPIIESAMLTYIDDMKKKLLVSEPINTAMWGYSNTSQDQHQNGDNTYTFDKAVTYMKNAFTKKLNFMDGKIEADNYRN